MGYITEGLNVKHKKGGFFCNKASLDNYIQNQAGQDIRKKISACFVLSEKGSGVVIAYYTLSNSSIPNELIPHKYSKKLPKSYIDIPVTLLGRLAVDENYKGKGIGNQILVDALKRCFKTSNSVASFAVVVDPLDEDAEDFYKRFGFILLPGSKKMFLAMLTIESLFMDS